MKHLLLFSVILILGACQGDRFEPFSLVNSVRIMAVQSSNPELRSGEEAQLSALVFVPEGSSVTYEWEWCPFRTNAADQYACPFTKDELIAFVSGDQPEDAPMFNLPLEDFDLGTGETATLKYPAPQPFLIAFCNSIQSAAQDAAEEVAVTIPSVDCDNGYEISVRLTITENGKKHIAAKRINLWLGSEQPQDINPTVGEIRIRPREKNKQMLLDAGHTWVSEINDFKEDWYVLPEDEATPILVGLTYEIESLIDEESIQVYAKPARENSEDKFLEAKREVIEFQWLTTFGSLKPSKSIFFNSLEDSEEPRKTKMFFPTTDLSQATEVSNGETFIESCPALDTADPTDGCEINIWSVVRDDRLGVGWKKRSLIATGVVSADEVTP